MFLESQLNKWTIEYHSSIISLFLNLPIRLKTLVKLTLSLSALPNYNLLTLLKASHFLVLILLPSRKNLIPCWKNSKAITSRLINLLLPKITPNKNNSTISFTELSKTNPKSMTSSTHPFIEPKTGFNSLMAWTFKAAGISSGPGQSLKSILIPSSSSKKSIIFQVAKNLPEKIY